MVEPLTGNAGGRRSLYVHLPFCATKCPYCAFHSRSGAAADEMAAYLELLEAEVACRGIAFPGGATTIYIGGGTPNCLPAPLFERLLATVRRTAFGSRTEEFSCEVLPGLLNTEQAGILAAAGIDRVTMGVQAFGARALAAIGRTGAVGQAAAALVLLQEAGIRNLGIDMILGLPEEDPEAVEAGLAALLALGAVTHLSAYGLSIEAGTPYEALLAAGRLRLPEERQVRRLSHRVFRLLFRRGFRQYEVSNFARPGYESRHNSLTWCGASYVGIGESAVSADRECRVHNPARREAYREAVCSGQIGRVGVEALDRETRIRERVMLALRTRAGLDPDAYLGEIPPDAAMRVRRILDEMLAEGCLCRRGGHLLPTRKGFFWLDGYLARIFSALDS